MPKQAVDFKSIFEEAQLLFLEGKLKESVDAFSRALEAGADPFMAYLSRGAARLRLKETDAAIEDFSNAIEANKNNARPFYYRGMAYMVKNNYENAAKDFSRALELNPQLGAARFSRAIAYARSGKLDESSQDLRDVVPDMEAGLERFADNYGIIKTEMWKVMSEFTGEGATPGLELSEDEINTLKKWLIEG
ncbi:MAG: tetratricopeptide repeat protein [Nitrospiraceae bacterium]|nr:tetratricopeptide repeat protein [Nitrospiraceae bacterium]